MPEGPEIRRAADRIASVIEGRAVDEVFFAFPELKPWEDRLRGQRVRRAQPRGKALLIRFEQGVTMYSHNQLYGRWFIRERGVLPPTRRQLRAAIHTERPSALLYSASEIDLLDDEIDSIRLFDPETQRSADKVNAVLSEFNPSEGGEKSKIRSRVGTTSLSGSASVSSCGGAEW